MENLSAREEEVMQILWDLEKALVRDIIEKLPNPKPPYTTVSSIVRLLEKKGFVSHKAYGNTHEYFPIVPKADYRKRKFKGLLTQYFDNSIENMVSFIVKEKKISPKELEKVTKMISKKSENTVEDDSE